MKRPTFQTVTVLGTMLLLASGLAWTAPREPKQAPGADAAKEISLFAPTGLRASLEKLTPGFEATGYKINATIENSGLIKKRVIDGEAFDLAVMLMPIADAVATGNLAEKSVKPLGSVPLGVAVKKGAPKPDISTPEALKQALLAAKSIAYPHGTPGALAGIMVDDVLAKLGITDQILPKVKTGGAAAVVKGDADIAIFFTNELIDPGLDVVGTLPPAVSAPAQMVGVISAHARNPAGAKKLLDYLASPAAKAVYKSNGMPPAS